MSVVLRLARRGTKKRPVYAMVVTDSRNPRDGRFLEKLGTYNPLMNQESPERLRIQEERVKYWLGVGAQPSDRVARLLASLSLIEKPSWRETPKKSAVGKKRSERAEARAAKQVAAAAPTEDAVA